MPLCAYRDAHMRANDTVVENIFIREYMPSAPEPCVKVYLWGLMQCQSGVGESTPEAFARTLGLTVSDVLDAFSYWEQRGLVSVCTRPAYTVLFLSARHAMPQDPSVYSYSSYNEILNRLFAPRIPTPAELQSIYDWTDIFAIEQDAVPLLIGYGRSKMKQVEAAAVHAQIRYIDKIARQWADSGIHTRAEAEAWLDAQESHSNGLSALMRHMGMHRAPTAAERKLYQSWMERGFSPSAVQAAADRMTGAYSPNFNYLNDILGCLATQGAMDECSVRAEQSEALCREALTALGMKNPTPSSGQLESYRKWVEEGFDHERILLACEICRAQGRIRTQDVYAALCRWQTQKLSSIKEIRAFEEARANALSDMNEAFARMGMAKKAADADAALYLQWLQEWQLPSEVIYLASEYAHGSSAPYRTMQRILQDWHQAGIRTVRDARKEHEERQTKAPADKLAREKAYSQRTYGDDLSELFEQL